MERDAQGKPIDPEELKGTVRIRSPLPHAEVYRRLDAQAPEGDLFAPRLAGSVRPERIRLSWRGPLVVNSFKPVFDAWISSDPAGTLITGKFRIHALVLAFMIAWLVVTAIGVAMEFVFGEGRMVAPGLFVVLLAVVLVKGGAWAARPDRARIVAEICAKVNGTILDTEGDES